MKFLPCGHMSEVQCSDQSNKCEHVVLKVLPCGHMSEVQCSDQSNKCEHIVLKVLPCGHMSEVQCSDPKCDNIVMKVLPCGHSREVQCSDPSPKCVVTKSLHSGHIRQDDATAKTSAALKSLSLVKSGFGNKQPKQTHLTTSTTVTTGSGKICRRLADTGVCEENKKDKSCQDLHPAKCSYYANFGLARINPKGCWSNNNDCKFLHVVICRYKYKALCKKQVCSLQHLQPGAV
jgi:hypothetical protein